MAGVGHWRLDLQTSKPSWSKAVYDIHGVTPGTFNPEFDSAIDFYHPDDRLLVTQTIDAVIRDKSEFSFQLRLIRADGSLRHVVSKGVCEVDATGKPVAIIGLFQDVDRTCRCARSGGRKRAPLPHFGRALDRYHRPHPPRGIISYASPACWILGITPEQAVGRCTLDFVHPDQRAFAARTLDDLFSGEEPDRSVRREFRVLTPDGGETWLEGNPTILRDEVGRPVEVITTYRDVTARKALEIQLGQAALARPGQPPMPRPTSSPI